MPPTPSPALAPAPNRAPDFAVRIAIDLIAEYEKKRGAVQAIGLKLPKLSLAARMVFVAIASRAWKREEDRRYRSHPGIHGYIKFITGANPNRTIPKAIAELEKAGLLRVTRRFNEKTRRRESHLYEIIESPEAYQAVCDRNAAKPEHPRRVRAGAFPAAVEELEAARRIEAEYPAIYAARRDGATYIPHRRDRQAALIIVRVYPDVEYRAALLDAWANPETLGEQPPPTAHNVRQLAFAPDYLPAIDRYWRSIGCGPKGAA